MKELTEKFLKKELATKSIRQIADELGTYPNKIARAARKFGLELPTQSEGQKRSIKTGRSQPVMLGKKHDPQTLEKISVSRHKKWDEQKESPEYDELVERYRKGYNSKSAEEKEMMHKKAAQAIYATKKTGSKMERFILEKLREAGYNPEFHAQQVVLQEDLEVDIYLAEINVAIEIDGLTHDSSIYGEEHLERRRRADSKKNGLLMMNGFTVIRVPNKANHVTKYTLNAAWQALKVELDRIEKEQPEASVIHLEIN